MYLVQHFVKNYSINGSKFSARGLIRSITDLQKTMTVLSATQASFSKLQSLSLFDYLR